MSTLAIVLLIVGVLVVLLAVGGFIAVRRRMADTEDEFRRRVDQANNDLAAAHAADNGWNPERLDAAARAAFAGKGSGEEIKRIELIQVIDKPGTEEDEAVFHVETDAGTQTVTLSRRGDDWIPR